MKILVATGLYPPEIGGPATHVEILERELPSHGMEVVTVPFRDVRTYPKVVRHIAYFFLLLKKMRGVSVVYALDPVSVGLPALFAARVSRKIFVLRVAGDYAWEQATGRYGVTMFLDQFVRDISSQKAMVRFLAFVERFVARCAREVVVPSQYLKDIVTLWGIPTEKITVVHNAFTPVVLTETKKDIRARLGYEGVVLASAGRLVPWKGFSALVSVVASLRKGGIPVSCVIVGDGPEKERLVAYTKECGVSEYVKCIDRQSKQALAETLSGADIFVLNTAYEGFSHQLLEVMALKVPIVTTAIPGNNSLLTHGKTALLVTFNDQAEIEAAVRRLIQDSEQRERLCNAASDIAVSFTVARMVDGIHTVFEHVEKI